MMNCSFVPKLSQLLLISFFLYNSVSLPQVLSDQKIDKSVIEFVSPKPGSSDNSPSTNIIINLNYNFNSASVLNPAYYKVIGSESGTIQFDVILSDNNRTIILKPFSNFETGETITVDLSGLSILTGNFEIENYFRFSVANRIINKKYALKLFLDELGISEEKFNANTKNKYNESQVDSLPSNYPELIIEKYDNPAEGKLFFSVFGSTNYPANMIIENNGNPVYYNELLQPGFDFKKQVDGTLTYYNSTAEKYYALNNKYEVIDSFECGNGYETDLHELQVMPNGNAFLLGEETRIIDMSVIVEGGKMDAEIIGSLIQELDNNKNVIFQWKSLDYIPVLETSNHIDLTAQVIDYIHSNSIDVDLYGNLLLSSRHLDEITKINSETGEIIWRLGGKENQFTFINENRNFSHQHDVRRIANGNILMFDNGNFQIPAYSRVVEYNLDEDNFTATKVWENIHTPYLVTNAMGSARRFANGNTLIDWVRGGYVTEVRADGSVALSIKYPGNNTSYRVIKDDWQTNLYTSNFDGLNFDTVQVGNTSTRLFDLSNNSDHLVTITGIFYALDEFEINESFPIAISPFNKIEINIGFTPSSAGEFTDTLNIRSDTDSSIVNYQMIVTGFGTNLTGVEYPGLSSPTEFSLEQNYPNPFNPVTSIQYVVTSRQFVTLNVYDVLGNEIATLVNEEKSPGTYKVEFNSVGISRFTSGGLTLPSGIYFYQLKAGNYVETKKMILMK